MRMRLRLLPSGSIGIPAGSVFSAVSTWIGSSRILRRTSGASFVRTYRPGAPRHPVLRSEPEIQFRTMCRPRIIWRCLRRWKRSAPPGIPVALRQARNAFRESSGRTPRGDFCCEIAQRVVTGPHDDDHVAGGGLQLQVVVEGRAFGKKQEAFRMAASPLPVARDLL